MATSCNTIRISNVGEMIITWDPVGAFEGIAKDASAAMVEFREDGGTLEMAADGIYGKLEVDNDFSARAVIKLDESSPTYGALMGVYLGGKGVMGKLSIVKSNGESDVIDCAHIKDMGQVTEGFKAQNFREVTFEGSRRNFDLGSLG